MSLSIEGGTAYKGSYNADDAAGELTSPNGSWDEEEFSEEDSEGNDDIFSLSNATGPGEAREAWAVNDNAIISASTGATRTASRCSSSTARAT